MAIEKNGEKRDSGAPENENLSTAEKNKLMMQPPCGPTEEDLENFELNMYIVDHLMEANSKTPVVIDEEVRKILVERFQKAYVRMTGMTLEAAMAAAEVL